jgi:GDP-4-dehydro-6-deoxy-D-mannose reductase
MEKPHALITGAAGFCGRHLSAHLADHGYDVFGVDLAPAQVPGATLLAGDIRDTAFVQDVLQVAEPTHVFHLAALTGANADWEALHDVNVRGTSRLLQAMRLSGLNPAVLITGSSAVYGLVGPAALPIAETQCFSPATLYAVSKIAQEMLANTYYAAHGMRVIRARAFNLTGPGESSRFVTSAFAHQIAEIEAGRRGPVLRVGNLEAVRDFTDVRDAACAYRLLAEFGEPGSVYNVCSGQATSIRQVLDGLLALSSVPGISVELDPERLQHADVPAQVGDGSRLRQATGWAPRIPLRQTLLDVLDSWRRRSGEEP